VTYAASAVEVVAADTAALTNSTSAIWKVAETIATSTSANAIANAVAELNDGAAKFAANFTAGEGGLIVMNDGTNTFVFEFKSQDTDGGGADDAPTVEAADLKLVGIFDGLSLYTNAHTDNFA
jgi:hypothetical protein